MSPSVEKLIKRHPRAIADSDTQGLATHSLRNLSTASVSEEPARHCSRPRRLGHSNVAVKQKYLATDRDWLNDLILQADWTRRSRKVAQADLPTVTPTVTVAPIRAFATETTNALGPHRSQHGVAATTGWLPGFEASTGRLIPAPPISFQRVPRHLSFAELFTSDLGENSGAVGVFPLYLWFRNGWSAGGRRPSSPARRLPVPE